ncbi:methionyl aminopeptidase [Saccharopolyspora sp. HNM0983]|uniref:Methionyl aminopeptidase n=1 Tax=Saccharopolyspora montiporae TaxID=2781240 RepID=A0A929BA86_9PSEU|nr:methionyl aminopeptidase [Saccharopolyspora sp. HNM0983]
MIELRSSGELDALREAGRVVAQALAAVREHTAVGVRCAELDAVAREVLDGAGAVPAGWAPRSGAGAIGTSVNDAVLGGVPDGTRLCDGDLVGVVCGARLQGWCAAAAVTVPVGASAAVDLVGTGQAALADGIAAARAGGRVGDVAHAVGVVLRGGGFGVPAGLGGVGRAVRAAPFVPRVGRPGRGAPLRPGMVVVIDPVLLAGGGDAVDADVEGVVRTRDGSCAVHVGHMVAVTERGPRVLTAP